MKVAQIALVWATLASAIPMVRGMPSDAEGEAPSDMDSTKIMAGTFGVDVDAVTYNADEYKVAIEEGIATVAEVDGIEIESELTLDGEQDKVFGVAGGLTIDAGTENE